VSGSDPNAASLVTVTITGMIEDTGSHDQSNFFGPLTIGEAVTLVISIDPTKGEQGDRNVPNGRGSQDSISFIADNHDNVPPTTNPISAVFTIGGHSLSLGTLPSATVNSSFAERETTSPTDSFEEDLNFGLNESYTSGGFAQFSASVGSTNPNAPFQAANWATPFPTYTLGGLADGDSGDGVVTFEEDPATGPLPKGNDGAGSIAFHVTTITESGGTIPDPTPSPTPGLGVLDTTTGQPPLSATAQPYTGPVSGLQEQYIDITPDNLNITVSTPNWFIHSGSGTDAIAVSSGTNVLDGSTGSNFLTGGSGTDTFFLDDRSPSADVFSTVVGFHSGDDATVFGVNPTDFMVNKLDNQGAAGFTGLDFAFSAPGHANANIVLAGFSSADLTNGRLTTAFGTTPDLPGAPGSQYLLIHAN